jgi:hypothetical protein
MSGQPNVSATLLYNLLNKPNKAKGQYKKRKSEGEYGYGYFRDLKLTGFENHLTGQYPKALACVTGGFANFICWDIDQDFERIAPFVVDALRQRKLNKGAFGTSGSSPARGKIVLCFRPRIPQAVAYRLAQEVRADVKARIETELLLVPIDDSKFDAYPKNLSGGDVRILGRNLERDGPLEQALDLELRPSDLKYVKPVTIPYSAEDAVTRQRAQWATKLINAVFTGTAKDAYKLQVKLADEAVRLEGEHRAAQVLHSWCSDIAGSGGGMRPSTAAQLKRKDAAERAVKWVLANHREVHAPRLTDFQPLDLSEMKLPKGARNIYETLTQYVSAYGLSAHCFGLDYGRLAAFGRYRYPSAAWKSATQAEDCELLFRLHQGRKHGAKSKGLLTLWCLRGQGETLQEAVNDGIQCDMFRAEVFSSNETTRRA